MEWWHILLIVTGGAIVWFTFSILMYRPFFKRFYDFILSLIALIVFSPLLLILLIVTAIQMGGNPFFVQARPGRRKKLSKRQCIKKDVPYGTYGEEKIFNLIKLRTMTNKKDENGNLLPDEQRLTRYGKFLRSTSLDELFSIINILKGDLSIVGPRPLRVEYLSLYNEEQSQRHNVRPGLTGLAQVNGRNALTWEEKFSYDVEYVYSYSFFKDLKIFLKTIGNVFK